MLCPHCGFNNKNISSVKCKNCGNPILPTKQAQNIASLEDDFDDDLAVYNEVNIANQVEEETPNQNLNQTMPNNGFVENPQMNFVPDNLPMDNSQNSDTQFVDNTQYQGDKDNGFVENQQSENAQFVENPQYNMQQINGYDQMQNQQMQFGPQNGNQGQQMQDHPFNQVQAFNPQGYYNNVPPFNNPNNQQQNMDNLMYPQSFVDQQNTNNAPQQEQLYQQYPYNNQMAQPQNGYMQQNNQQMQGQNQANDNNIREDIEENKDKKKKRNSIISKAKENRNKGLTNNTNNNYNMPQNSSFQNLNMPNAQNMSNSFGMQNNNLGNSNLNNLSNMGNLNNMSNLSNNLSNVATNGVDYNSLDKFQAKKPVGRTIAIVGLLLFMIVLLFGGIYLYLQQQGIFDYVPEDSRQEQENETNVKEVTLEEKEDNTNKENKTESKEESKEETQEPTQEDTIDIFFEQVGDYDGLKLIGSKNVGYMLIPTDMSLLTMNDTGVRYVTEDEMTTITIKTFEKDKEFYDISNGFIDQLKDSIEDMNTIFGKSQEMEYSQISGFYSNKNVYITAYVLCYDEKPDTIYWLAAEYPQDKITPYGESINNFTPYLTGKVPTSIYNESDYITD